MRTLVLNAGYEPMQIVSWQRALCLVLSSKAEIIADHGKAVRTVSSQFPLPSIVRLKSYVKMVRRIGMVRCSRKNILLRDNHQCQYCAVVLTAVTASIDHIIPRSRGGKTSWTNVVACCSRCNSRKGSSTLQEAGMSLLSKPTRPTWGQIMDISKAKIEPDWLRFLEASA